MYPKTIQKAILKMTGLERVGFLSSKNPSKEGPAVVVRQKIAQGQMKSDFKQMPIVRDLQEVYEDVQGYSPSRLFSGSSPKGLYIYGSVGAGKTMLMDIFYNCVKVRRKRRAHFNDFMADVHARIHRAKQKSKPSNFWGSLASKGLHTDSIGPVARELVKEAWLLCFDEFQVTDIADAMILKTLFTEMFSGGMVMVATSNRPPDDLYKDGLQRSNFLPFIPILKKHCKVSNISGKDYRTSNSGGIDNHYLLLSNPNTKAEMDLAFKRLCQQETKTPAPRTLHVLGHTILFKKACGRVLYVSFKELCEKPLGMADYIEIARNFNTILLKDVPTMNMNHRNQARRFILLIDTLYDYRVRIQISAAVPAKYLFSGVTGKAMSDDQQRMIMDDLRIEKGSVNAQSSLFLGSEEVFAFERTVSRIVEMCSDSYWKTFGV